MSDDEAIEILSTSGSEYSSVISSDSSVSSAGSNDNTRTDGMNTVEYANFLVKQEKERVKKKIDRLAKKHEKRCKELLRHNNFYIEQIKEEAEYSIGPNYCAPRAPGNSIARNLEKYGNRFHNQNRMFFRDSERDLLAIRNTVLNRSCLKSRFLNPHVSVREVDGESWRVGNYVLLGPRFVYKDRTRPRMMYGRIGQIMEFLAVKERVRIRVFLSATVFEEVYQFTHNLKNLSLNRNLLRDLSLRTNRNLHRNGQPYSHYNNNPDYEHPYFSSE